MRNIYLRLNNIYKSHEKKIHIRPELIGVKIWNMKYLHLLKFIQLLAAGLK